MAPGIESRLLQELAPGLEQPVGHREGDPLEVHELEVGQVRALHEGPGAKGVSRCVGILPHAAEDVLAFLTGERKENTLDALLDPPPNLLQAFGGGKQREAAVGMPQNLNDLLLEEPQEALLQPRTRLGEVAGHEEVGPVIGKGPFQAPRTHLGERSAFVQAQNAPDITKLVSQVKRRAGEHGTVGLAP